MRKRIVTFIILVVVVLSLMEIHALAGEAISLNTATGALFGTLELPAGFDTCPFALIISGSGPTDRDGNNSFSGKNNSLRFLAESLASRGIASLRFDKRGVGQSSGAVLKEEDLRFETCIEDAKLWCEQLRQTPRLRSLLIIGHSEGSLIGMIASYKAKADGLVSIAGTASPASELILDQLKPQLPAGLYKEAEAIIEQLKRGKEVDQVPGELYALFRPSVQPYLMSWFKYDPVAELSLLRIPILIIQGSTDIQVPVDSAKVLTNANPRTETVIIEGMNHVLKRITGDLQQQIPSYTDPSLPIVPDLVDRIADFSKTLERKPNPRIQPTPGNGGGKIKP